MQIFCCYANFSKGLFHEVPYVASGEGAPVQPPSPGESQNTPTF